jgi:ketosteroid isomerase-like protein
MFLGHDGILEHVTSWANMWEDWSVEVDRFSRNKATGMELDALHAELYTVRDGQIVRWQGFSVRAEAAGVAERRDTGRAMSQENVEVVRRMLQAFADGGLDAMAEFWDPDIDWRAAEGAIDDVGEMHGPVVVRRYIQDWIDTFDDFGVVVEELRDVGDDRVLSIQRLKGQAKLSGAETDLRYALVSTVRDGKVVRAREYLNAEDALEAVGLRE